MNVPPVVATDTAEHLAAAFEGMELIRVVQAMESPMPGGSAFAFEVDGPGTSRGSLTISNQPLPSGADIPPSLRYVIDAPGRPVVLGDGYRVGKELPDGRVLQLVLVQTGDAIGPDEIRADFDAAWKALADQR